MMVSEEDIKRLHPALQPILERELAKSNRIVQTWRGWPSPGTVGVGVTRPFGQWEGELPAGVRFRAVNDPHYWISEYEHEPSKHLLVCYS